MDINKIKKQCKVSRRYGFRGISRPEISSEIEPLIDVCHDKPE